MFYKVIVDFKRLENYGLEFVDDSICLLTNQRGQPDAIVLKTGELISTDKNFVKRLLKDNIVVKK